MACQCLFVSLGYAAAAYVAYKFLTTLYNIFFPYFIAGSIDLKKKAGADWAVVTGATDGIGKAYAFSLASRGFNVYLISRTQSKLDETKKEILEKYNKVKIETFVFDFSTASQDAYESLYKVLNSVKVGVLVNNVGMSYEYPEVLHKVEGGLQRLSTIATINTLPPTLLTGAVIPQMLERKTGVVVNISSSASYNVMDLWAVYSATKKYVNWLTAILRKEYKDSGIIFQTVCPMMVATKMSKVKKSSFFAPFAPAFAESAIKTIGNIDETTGYFSHQLQAEIMGWVPAFVMDHVMTKMSKGTRAAALRKKAKASKDE